MCSDEPIQIVLVMLAHLRIFRLCMALPAVTLLFGSTLPLVRHACAIALQQQQQDMGACNHQVPSAALHAAMQHHGVPAPSDEPLPCRDAAPHPATRGTCCFLETAAPAGTTAPLLHVSELQKAAYLPAQTLVLQDAKAPLPARFRLDTGPPRAPVRALHLLYRSFLI